MGRFPGVAVGFACHQRGGWGGRRMGALRPCLRLSNAEPTSAADINARMRPLEDHIIATVWHSSTSSVLPSFLIPSVIRVYIPKHYGQSGARGDQGGKVRRPVALGLQLSDPSLTSREVEGEEPAHPTGGEPPTSSKRNRRRRYVALQH